MIQEGAGSCVKMMRSFQQRWNRSLGEDLISAYTIFLASSSFFSLYDGHLLPTKVEDMIEDHKYLHQQYAIEACLSFLIHSHVKVRIYLQQSRKKTAAWIFSTLLQLSLRRRRRRRIDVVGTQKA
ncbi:hypothetical protein OPV22_027524 [Ensete ventricosum]|uniref:Uncharacterized protein n=1 Tax=Ensete ventricosum TaxID=4639 RepID=A0AAV8P336_ENSVE|nr:hypothetical protein OPV22_027524 [Ensete ventricosum]